MEQGELSFGQAEPSIAICNPVITKPKRERRSKDEIEQEKRDKEIRKERREFKRKVRDERRQARIQKRAIKDRLDAKCPILEAKPEGYRPSIHPALTNCRTCGDEVNSMDRLRTDENGDNYLICEICEAEND